MAKIFIILNLNNYVKIIIKKILKEKYKSLENEIFHNMMLYNLLKN